MKTFKVEFGSPDLWYLMKDDFHQIISMGLGEFFHKNRVMARTIILVDEVGPRVGGFDQFPKPKIVQETKVYDGCFDSSILKEIIKKGKIKCVPKKRSKKKSKS